MADPTFQQKKEWARGKNLQPATGKPTLLQSLWASTPGRLANYLLPQSKAPSLLGRVAQNATVKTAQSVVTDPVDTESQSYGAGKAKMAAAGVGISALGTVAKHAGSSVLTPKNLQWMENHAAALPGIGPAVQAAQARVFRETWPSLSVYMKPGAASPDLRPIPPAQASRDAPGLLSIGLRSEPVQSLLSAAIRRNHAFGSQDQ